MRRFEVVVATAALVLALSAGAVVARDYAARPRAPSQDRSLTSATTPMKIVQVRASADACGASCAEWIAAEGRIVAHASAAQLRGVLRSLGGRKVPLLIHSAGGSVEEAYALGQLIRDAGLPVVVGKTDFSPCAAGDAACRGDAAKGILRGRPHALMSVCASACTFVLAAGVQRHVGPLSFVGVHQYESRVLQVRVMQKYRMVSDPATGAMTKQVISEERIAQRSVKTTTTAATYDKSQAYFVSMGIGAQIMTPLRATSNKSMHWLTAAELSGTKMATDRKAAAQVLGLSGGSVAAHTAALSRDAAMSGAAALTPSVTAGQRVRSQLIRAIHQRLKVSNCLDGAVADRWDGQSQRAVARFAAATNSALDARAPTRALLSAIRELSRPDVCGS